MAEINHGRVSVSLLQSAFGAGSTFNRCDRSENESRGLMMLPGKLLAVAVVVLAIAAPAAARGATTPVNCSSDPDGGGGTALQSAIASASPGDTLVISGNCVETATNPLGDGPTVYTVDKSLTLEAAQGADAVLYPAGNRLGRVLEVTDGAHVTLENLYVKWANYETGSNVDLGVSGNGGGLYVAAGSTVTVADDMFLTNTATNGGSGACNGPQASVGLGGGIYNAGTLTVRNTLISDNSPDAGCFSAGGGIYNAAGASATISQSNIDDNGGGATLHGGGIYNDGMMSLTGANVSDGAAVAGGGIYNDTAGSLTLTDATIWNNQVNSGCVNEFGLPAYGGGIDNAGSLHVLATTIDANHTDFVGAQGCTGDAGGYGGGVFNTGTFTIGASILAGNSEQNTSEGGAGADPDCDSTGIGASDRGYNVVGDGTGCSFFTAPGDDIGNATTPINPELGAFGGGFNGQLDFYASTDEPGYGGPPVGPAIDSNHDEQFTNGESQFTTWTMPPQTGSPALDAVPISVCDSLLGAGAVDQRGVLRPQGSACDIGAVEVATAPIGHAITYDVPANGAILVDAAHGVLTADTTTTGVEMLVSGAYDRTGNITYTTQSVPVQLNSDGSFSYTAPSGFTGDDSFTYQAIDPSTNELTSTITVTLDVGGAPVTTATSLGSSANPAIAGQLLRYTATVSAVPDGGTVRFSDGGETIAACGAVAVSSSGQATCAVTYDSAGVHTIEATYGGDAGFAGSSSTPLTETVNSSGASGGSGGSNSLSQPTSSGSGVSGNTSTTRTSVTLSGPPVATPDGTKLKLTCSSADGSCRVTEILSVVETLKGGEPTAVAAPARDRRRTVVVAAKTVTVAAGGSATITVTINQAGRSLLSRFGKLPIRLEILLDDSTPADLLATRTLTIWGKKH